jgi:hypothetical protein
MEIVSFSPITGHCVFVPEADLPRFRAHVARMTPAERAQYAPLSLSDERRVPGGAHFFVGVHISQSNVLEFLAHVIVDD